MIVHKGGDSSEWMMAIRQSHRAVRSRSKFAWTTSRCLSETMKDCRKERALVLWYASVGQGLGSVVYFPVVEATALLPALNTSSPRSR